MPLLGGTDSPIAPCALGSGRYAELEPIWIALEQGDRRGLCLEQRDGRVDDRLEQILLGVRVQTPGNRRPPRCLT